MTDWQMMRIVLLPQAFRTMLPAIISQLVVVLKDTSLVAFIANYIELLRRARCIQRNLDNPIQTFIVVALIYIVINYALGRLAQYIERRQGRAGRSAEQAAENAGLVPVGSGPVGGGAVEPPGACGRWISRRRPVKESSPPVRWSRERASADEMSGT